MRLFADPAARLDPPGRLFVSADHYVVRMLYSQGVPLERAGLGETEVDDRAVWQLLADNVHLFALTPTGLWLRETLATVFGIEERLDSASAEAIYARIEEQLASPAFAPRALLDRFRVESLSTTDAAGASLADHRALAEAEPGRIRPTFRPDAVVALDAAGWRDALAELEAAADREIGDYATLRRGAGRAPRCVQGARRDGNRPRGDERRHVTAQPTARRRRCSQHALAGESSHRDARRFEAHMLNEFARMSMRRRARDAAPHRQPARPQRPARRSGSGATSAQTSRSRPTGRAACDRCSRRAATIRGFAVILFTLDESTYSRELAPLAGHYPAVLLGCPWWFHDSPAGIDRFLDRVVETAGSYNLAGFVDDARALTALPARHDLWRRRTCGWLARKVAAGFLD